MKIILQRVTQAFVSIDSENCRKIGNGICALVGISRFDTLEDVKKMANKMLKIRIFSSEENKWDKSVTDMGYELLLISQFTLLSVLKGNKPDFHGAMSHKEAQSLFDQFVSEIRSLYSSEKIKTGYFGQFMNVNISNNGPVTIELNSR